MLLTFAHNSGMAVEVAVKGTVRFIRVVGSVVWDLNCGSLQPDARTGMVINITILKKHIQVGWGGGWGHC